MKPHITLAAAALVALAAAAAYAAEPKDPCGSLALAPRESIAFLHIPSIKALDGDLKRFAGETGVRIGRGPFPAADLLARRTGLQAGIDADRSATIAFLDPKKYSGRYTVYVLPVSDWAALLKAAGGEEMSPGIYALTATAGPRYVARRGAYALVTSSVRTLDAVAGAENLAAALAPETLARAAGPGLMLYVNVRRLQEAYSDEIVSWFRAASGQLYNQPDAIPYADLFSAYLLGIADFLDQMETAEAALRFEPDGLAADVAIRFASGEGVAKFLSAQTPGRAVVAMPADRTVASAVTVRLDPAQRTEMIMQAVRFFMGKAPRPDPLPETTKQQVQEAVRTFAESLGEGMTFLSVPASQGMGAEASLTILDLADEGRFRKGLDLMAAAWETLADQLNFYVRFPATPDAADMAGVPVTVYTPKMRFGIPSRDAEFRERLRQLYGPDGLVYRVAVVGGRAVIATGSDASLLRDTLERLKAGQAPESPPTLKRLQQHLPAEQHVAIAVNLPLFFGRALVAGGTPALRVGTIDAGREFAGLSLTADGTTARLSSWWPHEQIRLAMELLKRAAPDLSEAPSALFEPAAEAPAKVAPPATPAVSALPTAN